MRTLALGVALCLGVLSVPAYAEGPDLTRLQECMKTPSSATCKKDFEQFQKAFEDIANGKKPTIALPVSPDSLPISDLGKLLSNK